MKTLALAAFTVLIFSFSSCTSKQKPKQTRAAAPAPCPIPAAMADKGRPAKPGLWTCPMHPNIRKHSPGQCPICGMNLVQVPNNSVQSSRGSMPPGHGAFELSPLRQQMIGVKTGIVMKMPLFKNIDAAGHLAFDPELYTAQTEYAEALKELKSVKNSPLPEVVRSARHMVESARLRLKILGLSDKQIARIGAGESGESNLLITKPGQSVWIYADVFEMDLPYVHSGQSAEITAGFLGGQKLYGKVVSVDRVINPKTRTAKARILVSEGSTYLRPESYVNVTIHAPLGEQVSVPFDAVLDTGKHAWVFLVQGKGKFVPRLVQVKFYAGDEVAIAEGLQGGERIVTSANFLIDSESRLKGAGEESASSSTSGSTQKPEKSNLPSCPSGQHWDRSMAMCMPN